MPWLYSPSWAFAPRCPSRLSHLSCVAWQHSEGEAVRGEAAFLLLGVKQSWASGLCVWPLDCEMNYSFEATGFWKWESGQTSRGNRHSVWSVCRSLLFWFVSSLLPVERSSRRISHWIKMSVLCSPLRGNTRKGKWLREEMVNSVSTWRERDG